MSLIPVPTTGGDEVLAFVAQPPPDLTADGTGDALLLSVLDGEEVAEGLINGALAIGYTREGSTGLADRATNVHGADTAKLGSTCRKRFRGPGPAQIRLG